MSTRRRPRTLPHPGRFPYLNPDFTFAKSARDGALADPMSLLQLGGSRQPGSTAIIPAISTASWLAERTGGTAFTPKDRRAFTGRAMQDDCSRELDVMRMAFRPSLTSGATRIGKLIDRQHRLTSRGDRRGSALERRSIGRREHPSPDRGGRNNAGLRPDPDPDHCAARRLLAARIAGLIRARPILPAHLASEAGTCRPFGASHADARSHGLAASWPS